MADHTFIIENKVRQHWNNASKIIEEFDMYGGGSESDEEETERNNTTIETVNPNWVVTDTFFALDEADRIVEIIDLRHRLNDFLKDFGNCGYSVRPTERKKGYATEMLRQILEVARNAGLTEIHLSVERDNKPSVKTIIKMVVCMSGVLNLKEVKQIYTK